LEKKLSNHEHIFILATCPDCQSKRIVKNGSIHNKKQKYKCKDCGRQFVENPTKKPIAEETKKTVLLLEIISLAGIARITGVCKLWLQKYVNKKYADISREGFRQAKREIDD